MSQAEQFKINLHIATDIFVNETITIFTHRENSSERTAALMCAYLALEYRDYILKKELDHEQYLETLKTLKIINVSQFEILFGMKSKKQQALRNKIHDPLPYYQMGENTNILYNREIVEKWMENYTK